MRTYARDHNRLLSLVAQAIITQHPRPHRPNDLADPTAVTTHPPGLAQAPRDRSRRVAEV